MIIETKDMEQRIITINAVPIPENQAHLWIRVQTPDRRRTVITFSLRVSQQDVQMLIAGLGGNP